ncbi:hypothetical protein [Xylanimonas sp. McL0601]|uniref:hypothetical protein n=1 Tax=Xylanimonas sp. McL0601 TaxID=3414739 RepID=UPI003CF403B2
MDFLSALLIVAIGVNVVMAVHDVRTRDRRQVSFLEAWKASTPSRGVALVAFFAIAALWSFWNRG